MSAAAQIRFDGRVAIVTGAGGGLGRAYALELARRGASVLVNDYGGDVRGQQDGSPALAEQVVAEIRAAGGTAAADAHAVGSGEAARAIVAAASRAFGRVDILINNAGTALPGAITAYDDAAVDRHYSVNLIGGHHMMRAVWTQMVAQHYGRILNITSNGVMGIGGNAPYAASKAGMIGLTLDSALEGRRHNILVNCAMPAAYSRMIDQIPDPATVQWFRENLPAQKAAAALVWFVCEHSTITAQILLAGGGRLGVMALAEGGDIFDPEITAEIVAARHNEALSLEKLSAVPTQAAAAARYRRFVA